MPPRTVILALALVAQIIALAFQVRLVVRLGRDHKRLKEVLRRMRER